MDPIWILVGHHIQYLASFIHSYNMKRIVFYYLSSFKTIQALNHKIRNVLICEEVFCDQKHQTLLRSQGIFQE